MVVFPQAPKMQFSHLLAPQTDIINPYSWSSQSQVHRQGFKESSPPEHSTTHQPDPVGPSPPSSPQPTQPRIEHQYSIINDIGNAFLSIFGRLRCGIHPYLAKLVESVRDLSVDIASQW